MLESEVVESNNEVLASFLCVFALHSSELPRLSDIAPEWRKWHHDKTNSTRDHASIYRQCAFGGPSARHNQRLNPARCRVLLVPAYQGKQKEAPAYLRKPGTDTISPQIRRLLYLVNRAGTARCVRPDVAMDATD